MNESLVTQDEKPKRRPQLWIKAIFSIVVTVLALGWAFHDVDLEQLRADLAKSNPTVLVAYFLLQSFTLVLRIVRWGLLVKPLGEISNRVIFSAGAVGIPATFFLPLRLGEFVRPALIRRAGGTFSGAMASVVVERIADGLFNVIVFFGFALWLGQAVPEDMRVLIQIALFVFGGGLICLLLLYVLRSTFTRFVGKLLSVFSEDFSKRVVGLLETFLEALGLMREPKRLALFLVLTVLYWTINGVSTSMLASSYVPDVSFAAGPFAISVVVFAIMIPAGPAFAGTMEAGFRLGLAPFGVVRVQSCSDRGVCARGAIDIVGLFRWNRVLGGAQDDSW